MMPLLLAPRKGFHDKKSPHLTPSPGVTVCLRSAGSGLLPGVDYCLGQSDSGQLSFGGRILLSCWVADSSAGRLGQVNSENLGVGKGQEEVSSHRPVQSPSQAGR